MFVACGGAMSSGSVIRVKSPFDDLAFVVPYGVNSQDVALLWINYRAEYEPAGDNDYP